MKAQQTSLFSINKSGSPNSTTHYKDIKFDSNYQWLEKHHYAGYDGQYNLYSKNQLIRLLKWKGLYGNYPVEIKTKMLSEVSKISKQAMPYYHVKSLQNIKGYDRFIIKMICVAEKKKLQK